MSSKNLKKNQTKVKHKKSPFNFFLSFFNYFKKLILKRKKGIIIQLIILVFISLFIIYFSFLHQIIIGSQFASEKIEKAEQDSEETEYSDEDFFHEIEDEHIDDHQHVEDEYKDDLVNISPWGCETNLQKKGTWCMAFEERHWCGAGSTICVSWDKTPSKPPKPEVGLHSFDCDSCQWNLICPENYVNCQGVCLYSWECNDNSL